VGHLRRRMFIYSSFPELKGILSLPPICTLGVVVTSGTILDVSTIGKFIIGFSGIGSDVDLLSLGIDIIL